MPLSSKIQFKHLHIVEHVLECVAQLDGAWPRFSFVDGTVYLQPFEFLEILLHHLLLGLTESSIDFGYRESTRVYVLNDIVNDDAACNGNKEHHTAGAITEYRDCS
jgi:hypothetical protein